MDVGTHLFDEALEDGSAVARVIDREVRIVPQALALATQNHHAGRVEGLNPHAIGTLAEQVTHALAHLGCGLVREGNRQDLAWPCLTLCQ